MKLAPKISVFVFVACVKLMPLINSFETKISLYLWLSYKLPDLFPDHDKAFILRESFNRFIEKSLKGVLIDEKRDEKPFYKEKEDKKNNFYSRRRKRV